MGSLFFIRREYHLTKQQLEEFELSKDFALSMKAFRPTSEQQDPYDLRETFLCIEDVIV